MTSTYLPLFWGGRGEGEGGSLEDEATNTPALHGSAGVPYKYISVADFVDTDSHSMVHSITKSEHGHCKSTVRAPTHADQVSVYQLPQWVSVVFDSTERERERESERINCKHLLTLSLSLSLVNQYRCLK